VPSFQSRLSRFAPAAYKALRFSAGLLYTLHGLQKTFGLFGGAQVQLLSRLGAAGVMESIVGPLLMLGLFTSPLAFLASGEMAVAYFLVHYPRGRWPVQNGGELAVLYCFIFLYISTRGGGRLSLDSLRR